MLTIDAARVADLIADGDTRWLNRGAHDLLGVNPGAVRSDGGLPRARSLYGTLADQLRDRTSFAGRLRRIIDIRRRYGIATAAQIDVPGVSNKAMLVMVHRLEAGEHEVTVLNFGGEPIVGTVHSEHLLPGAEVIDMFTDDRLGVVDDLNSFSVQLDAYQGLALLLLPPPEPAARGAAAS
jgi:hypothetical protein